MVGNAKKEWMLLVWASLTVSARPNITDTRYGGDQPTHSYFYNHFNKSGRLINFKISWDIKFNIHLLNIIWTCFSVTDMTYMMLLSNFVSGIAMTAFSEIKMINIIRVELSPDVTKLHSSSQILIISPNCAKIMLWRWGYDVSWMVLSHLPGVWVNVG